MKGNVNGMKQTIYTAPTLEKVTLAANDILLTSGVPTPGEYEMRGGLNTFNVDSVNIKIKDKESN